MPPSAAHSSIINRAARTRLEPVGFQQKGRSRFWYDDQGWRAFFVDFQPSSWSKGTYCNVGVMWLWEPMEVTPTPHWAFHVSDRVLASGKDFVSFDQDPGGFQQAVASLADSAATEALRLRNQFISVAAVASYYQAESARGWPGYHRSIALGLEGSSKEAGAGFRSVASSATGSDIEWVQRLGSSASFLSRLVDDHRAFKAAIEGQVARCRALLKLRTLSPPIITI